MRPIKLFLALAALIFAVSPALCASPTILYGGGEDISGTINGSVSSTFGGNCPTSLYARACLSVSANAADPPGSRFDTPTFGNQTTIWIHANTKGSSSTTLAGSQILGVYGSDGTPRLTLRGTASASTVKLSTGTTGAWVDKVNCNTGVWPINATHTVDFQIVYSASGTFNAYLDGSVSAFCTFSGDLTSGGITSVKGIFLGPMPGLTGQTENWNEIIVADGDTRGFHLCTAAPVANGNTMAWNGVVSSINPIAVNDANVISTSANNQIAEFTQTTCPPAGVFSVGAVIQETRLAVGATGPQHFDFIVRPGSGSTDYASADQTPTTSFANYNNFIWATNPACSCGWVTTDITNAQFGIESKN